MTGLQHVSPPERRRQVDAELTRLHGRQDCAHRLSKLHEEAATGFAETAGERRFHLTHAWVYALVDGDDARIAKLEAKLRSAGGLT